MKSEDLQNLVISKCKNGYGPTKIYDDLHGAISVKTIKRWCKMITENGTSKFKLCKSPGQPRTVRTRKIIQNDWAGKKTSKHSKIERGTECIKNKYQVNIEK